jgi:hypothetical protein
VCGASVGAQLAFFLLSTHALFRKSCLFFVLLPSTLHRERRVHITSEHLPWARIFPGAVFVPDPLHLRSYLFLALRVSFSNSELRIFSHHPCDLVSPSCSLSPLFSVQKYVWGCVGFCKCFFMWTCKLFLLSHTCLLSENVYVGGCVGLFVGFWKCNVGPCSNACRASNSATTALGISN